MALLNQIVLFQTLCCGYSLELSLRDNSNEYPQHRVQYTIFDILYFKINLPPTPYLELELTANFNLTISTKGNVPRNILSIVSLPRNPKQNLNLKITKHRGLE